MKANIRHSVIDLILSILVTTTSFIGFIVAITERHFWGSVGYCIFLLMFISMLLLSIHNVQWFDITNGAITVYCPFGMIKRVGLSQVKKAFTTNATIYSVKMLHVKRPCIVLCLNKSVGKADIDDAYNGKKKPYIILPYSLETKALICTEYKKLCDEELIVK